MRIAWESVVTEGAVDCFRGSGQRPLNFLRPPVFRALFSAPASFALL